MPMDLPAFIRSLGVEKAAELFDESPRMVRAWLYRERTPRPKTAIKLIERTKHRKDRLSLSSIYGGPPQ